MFSIITLRITIPIQLNFSDIIVPLNPGQTFSFPAVYYLYQVGILNKQIIQVLKMIILIL